MSDQELMKDPLMIGSEHKGGTSRNYCDVPLMQQSRRYARLQVSIRMRRVVPHDSEFKTAGR